MPTRPRSSEGRPRPGKAGAENAPAPLNTIQAGASPSSRASSSPDSLTAKEAGGQLFDDEKSASCAYDHPIESQPAFLRFNKFVLRGYRPFPMDPWSAGRSMFSLHNETAIIWSHFLPGLVFLWWAWGREASETSPPLLPGWVADMRISHTLSAACMMASALYHTFMVSMPDAVSYQRLLSIDLWGIFFINVGTSLCNADLFVPCATPTFRSIIAFGPAIASFFIMTLMSPSSKSIFFRGVTFSLQPLGRFICVVASYWGFGSASTPTSLWLLALNMGLDMAVCLAMVLNGSRLPERAFPRQFDFFNSHFFFHVATAAVLCGSAFLWTSAAREIALNDANYACAQVSEPLPSFWRLVGEATPT